MFYKTYLVLRSLFLFFAKLYNGNLICSMHHIFQIQQKENAVLIDTSESKVYTVCDKLTLIFKQRFSKRIH